MTHALDDGSPNGRKIEVDASSLVQLNLWMLASTVNAKSNPFIIQKESPFELLELRVIFSELRRRARSLLGEEDKEQSEKLPFEAFKRAFERLFYAMQDNQQPFDATVYDENNDGYVSWGEFFRVFKRRKITVQLSVFERLYLTFDNPEASRLGQVVSALVLLTIVTSSVSFMMSTMPICAQNPDRCRIYEVIERGCLLIFVIEYVVRICTVWAVRTEVHDKAKLREIVVGYEPIVIPRWYNRLFRFLCAPSNIVDLAAILPGVVGLFMEADGGAFVVLRLVRLTRIFRAFKNPALVAPLVVITRTVQQSTKALYVLAFNLSLGIVIFGSLMYMAEGGEDLKTFDVGGRWSNDSRYWERKDSTEIWNADLKIWEPVWIYSPFQSIPHSFWWAFVTATTVGYGDEYPTTSLGYAVAVATMVFSMVILALPVGVMGGTFSQEWETFALEKAQKAEVMEQEMKYITSAITHLDPARLSRLVLIEVWDERPAEEAKTGPSGRPLGFGFLGAAKLDLDLPMDRPITCEMQVPLEENPHVVARSVSGSIAVKVEWTPGKCDAVKQEWQGNVLHVFAADGLLEDCNLRGMLKVTVVSAEGLINLSCTGGYSSPFCTVLCYPTFSWSEGPQAYYWRMPTCRNKASPTWNASHTFEYNWTAPNPAADSKRRTFRMAPTAEGPPSPPAISRSGPPSIRLDEALAQLRDLAAEVTQQRMDLKQACEDVRHTAARVDLLAGVAVSKPSPNAAQRPADAMPELPNCVPG